MIGSSGRRWAIGRGLGVINRCRRDFRETLTQMSSVRLPTCANTREGLRLIVTSSWPRHHTKHQEDGLRRTSPENHSTARNPSLGDMVWLAHEGG